MRQRYFCLEVHVYLNKRNSPLRVRDRSVPQESGEIGHGCGCVMNVLYNILCMIPFYLVRVYTSVPLDRNLDLDVPHNRHTESPSNPRNSEFKKWTCHPTIILGGFSQSYFTQSHAWSVCRSRGYLPSQVITS